MNKLIKLAIAVAVGITIKKLFDYSINKVVPGFREEAPDNGPKAGNTPLLSSGPMVSTKKSGQVSTQNQSAIGMIHKTV